MKYIAYKIPFQSYQGVDYEVRIYAETDAPVAPAAVVLYGGEQPFVTDENDSDDIFEPVRHQTGTIQVVDNAGTGELAGLMEKLCPENNISNPVQLVEKNGAIESVIWQGFLNCESYNQDYIGTPQAIELPVNSVLEAMDSVQCGNDLAGVKTIRQVIAYTFDKIMSDSGMSGIIGRVYFSAECYAILGKYIDTTILYEEKEYDTETGRIYLSIGSSCKKILNDICTFMGMTVREEGSDIYFERLREKVGYYYSSFSQFKNNGSKYLDSIRDIQMQNFEWAGDGHNRSVNQGAKVVCVKANLGKYSMSLRIPDFVYVDVESRPNIIFGSYYASLYGNKSNSVYSNCHFYQYMREIITTYVDYGLLVANRPNKAPILCDVVTLFNNSLLVNGLSSPAAASRTAVIAAGPPSAEVRDMPEGSFLCMCKIDTDNKSEVSNGLYCMMLPCSHYDDSPIIYEINSVTPSLIYPGEKIKLSIDCIAIFDDISIDDNSDTAQFGGHMWWMLKIGDYYYNGTGWTTTKSHFSLNINNGNRSMEIPITSLLFGNVTLSLFGEFSALAAWKRPFEFFFKSIDLSYEQNKDDSKSDKTYNSYTTILNTNFSDEITIETNIASNFNNIKSPSIIHNDDKLLEPMSLMDYQLPDGTTEERRPEKDLLERMEVFYSKVRRKLDLDVAINSVSPYAPMWLLPQTVVEGLEETPIRYLPLAISRNWVQGTARLTCIEDINGDE